MEQMTTKQVQLLRKKNDDIQRRVESAVAFLKEAPEEKISRYHSFGLSFKVERLLRDMYTAIADISNQREAYELFGNMLCQLLVTRGKLKQELSLHEVTRDLVMRDASVKQKHSSDSSGYYRVRTLQQEFGKAIKSIQGQYKKWEVIPDETASRVRMNYEMNQLLRQKASVSHSPEKQRKMTDRYKDFLDEIERRISDCRHVLMITELTDGSSKRKRKAFEYLYEALQYRKELKNASKVYRQICKQKAI